jgi:hypothetical protein
MILFSYHDYVSDPAIHGSPFHCFIGFRLTFQFHAVGTRCHGKTPFLFKRFNTSDCAVVTAENSNTQMHPLLMLASRSVHRYHRPDFKQSPQQLLSVMANCFMAQYRNVFFWYNMNSLRHLTLQTVRINSSWENRPRFPSKANANG